MIEIGDKIGDYVVTGFLGKGGYGYVWKAEQKNSLLDLDVAIKFILPDEKTGVNLEKVRREAENFKSASGLSHILRILGAGNYKSSFYFVTEFAEGGSLDKWLKDQGGKAESLDSAGTMMNGILKGLENLHDQAGLIHRDLKPENILLMRGAPHLADFGISRRIAIGSDTNYRRGTLHYLPPEAFENKVGIEGDIWAAGIILQEILSGAHPFLHRKDGMVASDEALPELIRSADPWIPEEIPESFRRIISQALQKDRRKRFGSAREMRAALKKVLANPYQQRTGDHTVSDEQLSEAPTLRQNEDAEQVPIAIPREPPLQVAAAKNSAVKAEEKKSGVLPREPNKKSQPVEGKRVSAVPLALPSSPTKAPPSDKGQSESPILKKVRERVEEDKNGGGRRNDGNRIADRTPEIKIGRKPPEVDSRQPALRPVPKMIMPTILILFLIITALGVTILIGAWQMRTNQLITSPGSSNSSSDSVNATTTQPSVNPSIAETSASENSGHSNAAPRSNALTAISEQASEPSVETKNSSSQSSANAAQISSATRNQSVEETPESESQVDGESEKLNSRSKSTRAIKPTPTAASPSLRSVIVGPRTRNPQPAATVAPRPTPAKNSDCIFNGDC